MLRKSKLANFQPLHPDTNELTHRIVETSRRLELDPRQATIVGSSALILYGIMPPTHFDDDTRTAHERPGDVDHIVTPSVFQSVYEQRAVPGGALAGNHAEDELQHVLKVQTNLQDSHLLPADLITRYNHSHLTIAEYEEQFRIHHDRHDKRIPGTDLPVLGLDKIYEELHRRRKYDPKAHSDYDAVLEHLRRKS